MTGMVAAIRPDSWNFPLLVHVFGAMVLVGGLATAVAAQSLAWRREAPADSVTFARTAFRALLFVAFPAWWLMRVGGEWIYSREGYEGDDEPAWLGIGFVTGDVGGLLLLVTIVLAGFGARRLRRSDGDAANLSRIATVLAIVLLIAYLVAAWAMSAKPD